MNQITDISQLDLTKKYTYADYLLWWFEERVELIKGQIFKMNPAPFSYHQCISRNIFTEISVFLKRKKLAFIRLLLMCDCNEMKMKIKLQPLFNPTFV